MNAHRMIDPDATMAALDEAHKILAVGAPTDASSLARLATDLMSRHRLARDATAEMMRRVLADPGLRDAIMAEIVEAACLRFLQGAASAKHFRGRLAGERPIPPQRATDLTGWAASVANSLLDDFLLPDGRPLGDATRADLEAALVAYQTVAQDAEIKLRWVRLVQQGLTAGQRVRDAYTNDRLAELRAEARKVEQ